MNNQSPPGTSVRDFPPRACPERCIHRGRYVWLEPADADIHANELLTAASVDHGDQIWTYLPYGPFPTEGEMRSRVELCQTSNDPLFFTLRSLDAGTACGMASFMRINEAMGVIEIGHIWMAPALQRTRAATEAIFLMMDHALRDLKYRRLEWKCNAANTASRNAAERFGFTYEGTFRQHMIVKGRNRDTAWFSILDHEWPALRSRFIAWLDPENFQDDGQQIRRLERISF